MLQLVDLSEEVVEDAKRVLDAIVKNDFDRKIPRAALGLRWLRERDFISERSGFERCPVLLTAQGRNLAIFWNLADA